MADLILIDRATIAQALSWIHYMRREYGMDEPREERALRTALAQAEPVQSRADAMQEMVRGAEVAGLYELTAEPVQEPVAWVDERVISWLAGRRNKASAHVTTTLSAAKSLERPMALYTAPQPVQRTPATGAAPCVPSPSFQMTTQAEPPCDHCASPLFAALECRVCGRKEAK